MGNRSDLLTTLWVLDVARIQRLESMHSFVAWCDADELVHAAADRVAALIVREEVDVGLVQS